MKNPLSPQYQLYREQCNMNNAKSWAKRVHSIIDHLGFRNARINFNEKSHSLTSLKREYVINLLKECQASINSMSKLNYYVKYKKPFEI